ncbi:hypothetical protein ORV05_26255 [Amycolatopsis cynarae]|uniref:Uncharacterized protein n=1 Tax=Amycolatopsis cynarae TaxID=2995223 RepID=A0ABY7AZ18_9PSEU|nr:hypothetical protein [Amycolatopsis sp. HUAS 11-8]WAL64449.1 hypothetical protein ORV05_26255 [Amycolatopsis sp. HUAS 11-8]
MTNTIGTAAAAQSPAVLEIAPKRRPYWQTLPCPVWCSAEHTDDAAPVDRNHFSTWSAEMPLTLEAPEISHGAAGAVTAEAAVVEVFLMQHHREIEPRVIVGDQGTREFTLTPAEALELARALTIAAKLATPEVAR